MAAIAIPEKFAPLRAAYVEDAARKTTMWGVWLDTMRENIATVGADSLDFAQLDLLLDTVANGTGILESNLSRKGSLFWHMETDTHRVTFHAEGMCFRLGVPASVFSKGEKWTVTMLSFSEYCGDSRLKDACAALPVPVLLMDEVGMFVQA